MGELTVHSDARGSKCPPTPAFRGPHPQAVCCTPEGPGRRRKTGRQTGSRWERDEDGAREQPGGPRRPGSPNIALGRSVGKGTQESILKLGEPKIEGGDALQRGGGGAVGQDLVAARGRGRPAGSSASVVWAPRGQEAQ